jgi:uncharacterized integral membrane protein
MEELFGQINGGKLDIYSALIIMASSLVAGFIISLVYIFTNKNKYQKSFAVTLVMLPLIIAVIIMIIGDNIARAFSLAGAFTIIRYRSEPAEAKDISYIFFALAIGLACGLYYISYAALFLLILSVIMLILHFTNFTSEKNKNLKLKITVPEDVDYENLFDDIFTKYLKRHEIIKIKTISFGALFEISYSIQLKNDVSVKELIDDIRCRNNNLSISVSKNV